MSNQGQPKRSKAPDTRPARGRYWSRNNLAVRKVRNILRNSHITDPRQAYEHWYAQRDGRRMPSAPLFIDIKGRVS